MKKLTILILLAMAVVCRASAQNRVVTGTVSEEDGTPLTGAVVQVVGTNNAATAAIDGLYTLKNVPSGAVLRVSFLGYDPVEKKVDADRMDFILKASAQEIASVVVTGMQKMDIYAGVKQYRDGAYCEPAQEAGGGSGQPAPDPHRLGKGLSD